MDKVEHKLGLMEVLDENINDKEHSYEDVVELVMKNARSKNTELFDDHEFMSKALEANYEVAKDFIGDKLRDNKEFMEGLLKSGKEAFVFCEASERLRDDVDFLKCAMAGRDMVPLDYASERIKNNRDLIIGLVEEYGNKFVHGGDVDLKYIHYSHDKEFTLVAIGNDVEIMLLLNNKLLSDKDFIMEACKINYEALHYASDELKSDKDVVMTALRGDERAIRYVSESLVKEIKDVDMDSPAQALQSIMHKEALSNVRMPSQQQQTQRKTISL